VQLLFTLLNTANRTDQMDSIATINDVQTALEEEACTVYE